MDTMVRNFFFSFQIDILYMSKKNSKKDVLILVGAMLKAICIFNNITFCLAKKKVMSFNICAR